MSTSLFPAVLDAVMGKARASVALAGVNVADVYPVELMTGDWLVLGVSEADGTGEGGSGTQSWPHAQHQTRDEQGTLSGVITCAHGDDDAKSARDAAFAILAAVETFMRSDLELTGVGTWKTNVARWTYTPGQLPDFGGASVELRFSIDYDARL